MNRYRERREKLRALAEMDLWNKELQERLGAKGDGYAGTKN